MTPTLLAGIIAATLLAGAFGYLGIHREHSSSMRLRQMNKYRDRLRKLDNIILGLPPTYFPKALKLMVYASVIDSLDEMGKLSGEKNYIEQAKRVQTQLKQLQQQTTNPVAQELQLDNVTLREYKHLLKDLHGLISDLKKDGKLSQTDMEEQLKLVNDVILGVNLDFYCEAAKRTVESGNKSLALHYYSAAKGQIDASGSETQRNERLPAITARIAELSKELDEEKSGIGRESSGSVPDSSVVAEWDALNKEEEEWRKNYY